MVFGFFRRHERLQIPTLTTFTRFPPCTLTPPWNQCAEEERGKALGSLYVYCTFLEKTVIMVVMCRRAVV